MNRFSFSARGRTHIAAAMAAVALLAAAAPGSAQQVQLRWKFEPGSDHVYRQVQTNVMSMGAMGEMTQEQVSKLRHTVLSVAQDGAATVRVSFGPIRMTQEGPMGRQEFDSEADEEPADPGMAMLARLAGSSFEMTVTPAGTIQRVSGMEEMLEEMIASLTAEHPEMADQIRPMLEASFGEEGLKQMMQQGMQSLPREAVGAGSTWDQTITIPLPFGTVQSRYSYTLEELTTVGGRRVARIAIQGTAGEFEVAEGNPMAGMLEFSGGEVSGTMDFDVDRGLMLGSTVVTKMTIAAMGQPMQSEATVKMELVDS